jgi:hypothetical protein
LSVPAFVMIAGGTIGATLSALRSRSLRRCRRCCASLSGTRSTMCRA